MICSDIDAAISRLGGEKALKDSFHDDSTPLRCFLRPQDPNSHPICSTIAPVNRYLLRVQRKRKTYSTEIIGTIKKTAQFDRLADFQYRGPASASRELSLQLNECFSESKLELVPIVFSKYDTPKAFDAAKQSTLSTIRPSRMQLVNFTEDEPIPSEPLQHAVRNSPEGSMEDRIRLQLEQLLEQKPVCPRQTLLRHSSPDELRARELQLPTLCYLVQNGPWRGCCIRFGYDPRTSSESALYQLVEVRIGGRKRKSFSSTPPKAVAAASASDTDNNTTEPLRLFGTDIRATAGARFQLCDLMVDDEFRTLLEQTPAQATFDVQTGWYSHQFLDLIRAMIRLRILGLLQRDQAEIEAQRVKIVQCRHAFETNVEDRMSTPGSVSWSSEVTQEILI